MKTSVFVKIVTLLFFVVLFSQLIFADRPTITIVESGNISKTSNVLEGQFDVESGYSYQAFIAILGNFSYFNNTVDPTETISIGYNRTFDAKPFLENRFFTRQLNELTVVYNITNNFSVNADITMNIPFPTGCSYSTHESNGTLDSSVLNGDNLTLTYTLVPGEARFINATCSLNTISGFLHFDPALYEINVTDLASNYEFNILPKSYMSVTKQPLLVIVNNQNKTEWQANFEFMNDDDIEVHIEQIHLWSTQFTNTTENPADNIWYEKYLTTCTNDITNNINTGETCTQQINFSSVYVPVVWSEVFYTTLWTFDIDATYNFTSEPLMYNLDDALVALVTPANNTYFDVGANITLDYLVAQRTDCSIYTNKTGLWLPINSSLNVTVGSSYSYTASPTALDYVWNVLCTSLIESRSEYAKFNRTIHVNALPVLYQNISDLTWPEDENKSILMTDYFSDVENDSMNYTFQPDPIVNIIPFINNETNNVTFVPDPDFNGARLVQMIVWDPFGRNVTSNAFILTVTPVDDAPQIMYWNISNSTWWTINETYIETTENRSFTFDADATDADEIGALPDAWFFWFLDGMLQFIGKTFNWYIDFFQQGVRNVTLVVNDTTGLYDAQTWIFNVSNVNIPPTSITIPEQAWKQNNTFRINLSDWFTDIDAADVLLNYTYIGNTTNLTVSIDAATGVLTIVPDVNWIGIKERWMIINATDSYNHTNVSNNITLTVYPWITKQLPNITYYEDLWNDTINLSNYYNDGFYIFSNITWYTNASNLFFLLASNGILNITNVQDWFGNESVRMNVHQNISFYNDSSVFNIQVLPVNDPPIINDSTYQILENTVPPNNWVDLWNISFDVDNTYTELNYSIISQSYTALITCNIIGDRYLNCTAPPIGSWGTNYVNVSVTDGEFTDYAMLDLIIFHFNIAPQINDWNATNDFVFYEMSDGNYNLPIFEGSWLNFSVNVTDLENDSLFHYWYLDGVEMNNTNEFNTYFDYHSSGNYTIRYLVNQSQNLHDELIWNITVINRNRAPFAVNLTNPDNDTFQDDFFRFNWSNSSDPDADAPTADDYWDFIYILQVDDEPSFFSPELDMQFSNTTDYLLDVALPDGLYYWRVLAFDGLDSAVSETRMFMFDVNPPTFDLIIEPNPAEFGLRNVDVNWTIDELFLETAYVNITYPDNTFLGQYYLNVTLTPAQLTQTGDYKVTLYINDKGNNEVSYTDYLSVVNDTVAPLITLISPKDNAVLGTNMALFSYSYEDLNILENCSLFLQNMYILYDFLGGIMYMDELGPFERVAVDSSIEKGINYFVIPGLESDSYRWNVECSDLAGNTDFAPLNRTFRIMLDSGLENLVQFPEEGDEIPISVVDVGGFRFKAKIFDLDTTTSETVTGTLEIQNYGDNALYDISFLPSVDWIYFDQPIAYLDKGESVNVSFEIRSPAYPGEYMYHVVLQTQNGNLLVPGFLSVDEPVSTSLQVVKRVEVNESGYVVSLNMINYLKRPITLYLEDSIDHMRYIQYDTADFYTPEVAPPYLIMKRLDLAPNETLVLKYLVGEAELDDFSVPTIITNEPYDVWLEFVQPHSTSMLVRHVVPMEYILMFSFLVVIIIVLVLFWFKKSKTLYGDM